MFSAVGLTIPFKKLCNSSAGQQNEGDEPGRLALGEPNPR